MSLWKLLIANRNYPTHLYNLAGSEGDHNTRCMISEMIHKKGYIKTCFIFMWKKVF